MNFLKLPQLVDMRGKLPKKGSYAKRSRSITHRVWHHSLTLSHLAGSTAEAFGRYHISLGWPGCGYHFVIEPKNIIQTPKGPRARIVYANDINLNTYHVGNSNSFSLGICVAGDYRNEKLSDATKATIDELQAALVKDGIGSQDKSHHQMPGYAWKDCCVFNYQSIFKFLDGKTVPQVTPDSYTIQEGDTFWGIANNIDGISVDDLIAANPAVDHKKLKVGQKIKLGGAKGAAKPATQPQVKETSVKADMKTNSIVDYLKSIEVNSSLENRKKLAKQYGISNYSGTPAQNTQLLNEMRSGGSAPKATTTPAPTKKGDMKTTSIVDYLKSIKEDSSMKNRKKLAAKHGIKNYSGTPAQNTLLLKKLRG